MTTNRLPRILGSVLILCLAVLGASCGPTAGESGDPLRDDIGTFRPDNCVIDVPDSTPVQCGWVTVAEDDGNRTGALLELAVTVVKPGEREPEPDPIVYLDGGPGDPGISDVETWSRLADATGREVLLFSQRGSWYSRPNLVCGHEQGSSGNTADATVADEIEKATSCHDRLRQSGRILDAYTSADVAHDLETIRTALGYDTWNLYGISYGTRLALVTLAEYGSHVRSVVLEGVYPPEVNGYAQMAAAEIEALDNLLAACASEPPCSATYATAIGGPGDPTGLKTALAAAITRIDASPLALGEHDALAADLEAAGYNPNRITGADALDMVFKALSMTSTAHTVPAVIAAWARDDPHAAASIVYTRGEQVEPVPKAAPRALGMYYSVQCSEDAPTAEIDFRADPDPAGSQDSVDVMLAEFRLDTEVVPELQVCATWDVARAPDATHMPVTSEVPAFALAGGLDSTTPPSWASLAASSLHNATLVTFPYQGHGFSPENACAVSLVAAFLKTPGRPIDTSCVDDEPAIDFKTPR